ncbi:MAG: adenine-specific methyltransferase EcoRI family protein [Desulfovibrio sp.]|nr:adenine-specific methyltransferase EcoRI family protein [Desulfovibrio sp.]
MGKNSSLAAAKKAKQDEFYTRDVDIENELCHYKEHFKGKTVYCNCDDCDRDTPVKSEFWKYFVRNFTALGLKKLMATHYEPDGNNYTYRLELAGDANGDGRIDENDTKRTPLPNNGDFRNPSCIELLKEADILVTNPPFSLFRDYVRQLADNGKQFLIIGSQNAVTCREVFELLKEGRMWLGYNSGDMSFRVPDYYEPRATRYWQDESGQKWRSMGNICWFTNLDIPKRHKPMKLHGNYYDPAVNPKYDNCDAIEVSRVKEIPCDWDGPMGVPITFLNQYCSDQFKILGADTDMAKPLLLPDGRTGRGRFYIRGRRLYSRILIQNLHPEPRRTA